MALSPLLRRVISSAALLVVLVVAAAVVSAPAPARAAVSSAGTISGHVTMGATSRPATAGEVRVSLLQWTDETGATKVPYATTSLTDSTGAYAIADVPGGRYDVVADYLGSGDYLTTTAPYSALFPGTTFDLNVPTAYLVAGHVDLDVAGHAAGAGQVQVTARGNAGGNILATTSTDSAGNYTFGKLVAGAWNYSIEFQYQGTADYPHWYYAGPGNIGSRDFLASVALNLTQAVPHADVVVGGGAGIGGTLRDSSGKPIAAEKVHADAYDPRIQGASQYISTYDTVTGSDGYYRFRGLPSQYSYTVYFGGFRLDGKDSAYEWGTAPPGNIFEHGAGVDVSDMALHDGLDGVLVKPASISGNLGLTPSASQYPSAGLLFLGRNGTWVPVDTLGLAANGDYAFTWLPPGQYRVTGGYGPPIVPQIQSATITLGEGQNAHFSGSAAPSLSGPPRGSLDSAMGTLGAVSVTGWAIDPDTAGTIAVHVYVDGQFKGQLIADRDRPDVAAIYPAYGAPHGFDSSVSGVSAGPHTVCVYGINVGPAAVNTLLGCRVVYVRSADPFGAVDAVTTSGPGTVTVAGWAVDPDGNSTVLVHLYVDGVFTDLASAVGARPDVAARYPGTGSTAGFSRTLTGMTAGGHTVCAYAINQGAGTVNTLLGCRGVTVPGGNPVGYLDSVTSTGLGSVALNGWALDPDTASSISTHVYVDGAFVEQLAASDARPDIAAAFPGYGAAHGVSTTLTGLSGGTHTVCLYAINQLSGSVNTPLGCRTVTVPGGNPFGYLDSVKPIALGSISFSGWAVDPDTASSIPVHVYLDGAFVEQLTASDARPDLAAAFPGYGAAHGVSGTLTNLAGGYHTVCLYAINQLSGSVNTPLGCQRVGLPGGNPFGSLDSVTATAGSISVAGWAIDPDTAATVSVHLYVDGAFKGAFDAGATRSDVAAAFAGYGSAHGYTFSVPATTGSHTVCVYAINQGTGSSNPLLGCRAVTIAP